MHFFLGNIYNRRLKFLQVTYEDFDCDLTRGFFIHDFNKYLFMMTNPCVKSQQKIIIKRYLLKSWIKKIHVLNHGQKFVIINIFIEIVNKKCVLNHSQSFNKYYVKISVHYYKYFLRKSALDKHYFNIDKIELSGAP